VARLAVRRKLKELAAGFSQQAGLSSWMRSCAHLAAPLASRPGELRPSHVAGEAFFFLFSFLVFFVFSSAPFREWRWSGLLG
jgi:hypothetical protein